MYERDLGPERATECFWLLLSLHNCTKCTPGGVYTCIHLLVRTIYMVQNWCTGNAPPSWQFLERAICCFLFGCGRLGGLPKIHICADWPDRRIAERGWTGEQATNKQTTSGGFLSVLMSSLTTPTTSTAACPSRTISYLCYCCCCCCCCCCRVRVLNIAVDARREVFNKGEERASSKQNVNFLLMMPDPVCADHMLIHSNGNYLLIKISLHGCWLTLL